ncbi:MAG: protein kinase, partial [Gemmatimonadota bacterium]
MNHPSRIGSYDIVEVLGEGAMGTVYVAHQQEPVQRTVALKVLKATDEPTEVLDRYQTERQALAVMDHPSIARVFDAGITVDGAPYVVMERVLGSSILRYCDEHRLTIRQRLALFAKVCYAVQHAHQKGVIHRDLKPEHILVSEVDSQPLPKIIDFGIATAVDPEMFVRSRSESRDNVIGTPAYMSPEQIDGLSDVDTRSDIYSLGVILYELLVGIAPFDIAAKVGWGAVASHVMTDPPTPTARFLSLDDTQNTVANLRRTTPGQLRKDLHDDVDWIITRAMARDRTERYATAQEFALEIERHLAFRPVHAHPPSLTYYGWKFARRHRLVVGSGSVILVSLALFAVTTSIQSARVADARREADARRAQAESLIDFMLSDLRDQLEPLGRLDILDDVGDRAVEYFASVPPDGFTDEELASLSRAMFQIGDVRMDQGRLPEAGRAFEESLELASALSDRAPDDPDRLFAVGQAEFYAGNRYFVEGRFDEAMTHFSAYRDISDELARRDPANLTYQLEVGYSHTNVGTILHARGELNGALEEFTRSLDAKRLVAETDPENARRRYDIGQGHNLLGVLVTDMGRLDDAQKHFEADLAIKADLVEESPGNATFIYRLVVAHHYLAGIRHARGDVNGALDQYRAQRDLLEPLVRNDPSNLRWARNLSAAEAREAHARADVGEMGEAERLATSSVARMQRVIEQNPD